MRQGVLVIVAVAIVGGCDDERRAARVEPQARPPIAVATASLDVALEGETVLLDGSGSSDPDGDVARFLWEQTGGVPVTLDGAQTPSASC